MVNASESEEGAKAVHFRTQNEYMRDDGLGVRDFVVIENGVCKQSDQDTCIYDPMQLL